MIENVISERYARALLQIAREKNAIDAFGKELKTFEGFCKDNRELLKNLSDRYNDLFARERIVAQIADKAGFAIEIKNFLKILVHKGRIGLIATICDEYEKLAHAAMGRLVMKVVSAEELESHVYDDLLKIFGEAHKKEMVLKKQLLPDVIGGLRIHVGDRVHDFTVSHQIEKMKMAMAS